jgi:UDP-4-amino-4,6-dideoxy-N-acetyl-beta-L-altrosamine N-acetyltransferase
MNLENIKLTNFIDLNNNQNDKILSFRNHDNIRKWMYNENIIVKDNHIKFVKELKNDDINKYFLVTQNNVNIGVICFNNIDYENSVTHFGLYANPFEKIVGVGRILKNVSIDYTFNILKLKTLKLEVFTDNMQVVNLHKKFNFKVINKKVICMELKYENCNTYIGKSMVCTLL